jgi:iron complex outermembrane receptor protein
MPGADRPIAAATCSFVLGLLLAVDAAHATGDISPGPDALKRLSVEELMDVEVTSVSRRPERLSQAASAIQVISQEEIRRSGASSIPEALRLAPNLQVAQVNSSQWAISARGFNNVLANKLLVMIDGRTVYTPFYAGVFWDAQDAVLEDIDRIEVVSGPGGTLWGANAVNGVISITTKSAAATQGLFLEADAGTELTDRATVRYGGELGPDLHYRFYGTTFERDATASTNGADANDDWQGKQGGFRLDWGPQENLLTLQSDFYSDRPDPDGNVAVKTSGGNLLGRWEHTLSSGSDMHLQMYYDRTKRDFGNGFTEDLATYDLDGQHRFEIGSRQEIVWGFGVRRMDDRVDNLALFAFQPAHRILGLYSVFVQDEIALIPDRLRLTLGSKLEHNDYSGFENQPNIRLAWSPAAGQTLWTAISRAARTPARIDRDFYLYLIPQLPLIAGGDFDSEKLTAYEAGWRVQPDTNLSFSMSTFFNSYDDLRSAEPGPPPFGIPLTFGNGVEGHSYGMELAAMYQVSQEWRLRGGYTLLKKSLHLKPGSQDLNGGSVESDDPQNQLMIQSLLNLPGNVELDGVARYVDTLPDPHVSAYVSLDVRLAWNPSKRLELSLVGQNLLDDRHPEFVPTSPSPREIERSVYGRVVWRN